MNVTYSFLVEEFSKQFSLNLETMLGEPWVLAEKGEVDAGELTGNDFHIWAQRLTIHPNPLLRVIVSPDGWRSIGNAALCTAGLNKADDEDALSTYLEILTQTLSGVARAISGQLAQEVGLANGGEEHSITAPGKLYQLIVRDPDGKSFPIYLAIHESAVRLDSAPAVPSLTGSVIPSPLLRASDDPAARRIDFLLDVELPVSVSFGRAQLPLRDVIKLTTGSIVELNRNISEPVEVIVNNCVIARGEVVVIEGNYGVRIHEIVSRTERMRSID